METPRMKSTEFNSTYNIIALCLASYVVTIGFGVIMPFLPLYADEILSKFTILGFTVGIAFQIGILTSAFMFTRFLCAPAYGDLSDSSGRKPIILVGMTLYAFLLVGYGFAFDFISLLVLRALQGIASASVWPVGEALIVDTSSEEKTGRNLGYYIMSMQAGMASGPFVGFILYVILNDLVGLSSILSYRFIFVCQGIMGILATFIVAALVKDPFKSEKSVIQNFKIAIHQMIVKTIESPKYLVSLFTKNETYRTIGLLAIYIVAVINGFGNAMIFPLITLFLDDYYFLDPDTIALIIGIVGILALAGNPFGGYSSDKFGRKITTWISGLLRGITYLFIGFKLGLLSIILLFAVQRFLWSIYQPSFRTLQNDMIPAKVRGKEFGIVQALFNFGAVLGPIVGGAIYDAFLNISFNLGSGLFYIGAGISFAFAGFLSIFGSLIILIFIQTISKQENKISPLTSPNSSLLLSDK